MASIWPTNLVFAKPRAEHVKAACFSLLHCVCFGLVWTCDCAVIAMPTTRSQGVSENRTFLVSLLLQWSYRWLCLCILIFDFLRSFIYFGPETKETTKHISFFKVFVCVEWEFIWLSKWRWWVFFFFPRGLLFVFNKKTDSFYNKFNLVSLEKRLKANEQEKHT